MNPCTKRMTCRIGQIDRCKSQGFCSWQKIFGDENPVKGVAKNIISFTSGSKKRRLFNEANGICYLCEKEIKYFSQSSIDHVIPKSRGGSNKKENLKITHSTCNGRKGSKLIEELKLPFIFTQNN